jgi:hypothetical protein
MQQRAHNRKLLNQPEQSDKHPKKVTAKKVGQEKLTPLVRIEDTS